MDAAGRFSGADNTTVKLTFGSNFCTRPQNCVFEDAFCTNPAVRPNHRTSANLCGRIDMRALRDRFGPVPRFHVSRSPMFARDRKKHTSELQSRQYLVCSL